MKLLIDVGNTRIKLAVLQDDAMRFVAAVGTATSPATDPADQLAQNLKQELGALGLTIQEGVAVSVGRTGVNQAVEAACSPLKLRWINPSAQAGGVTNDYPDPSQLGADRWVAMIGLTRHFTKPHAPIVLASFGTATTVDTLSPENEFKGGLILPGVSMMHEALANGTAKLPNAPGAITHFPTDTTSAIATGVVAAQVGAVLRQAQLAATRYGQQPLVCVTGGAWPAVAGELQSALASEEICELPHIVLDGLAALANPA